MEDNLSISNSNQVLPMATPSQKQIVPFIIRIFIIVSFILICDRGIGTILKIFYFRQESGDGYRTTYAIDSTLADILVFGSSRANHSYVPEIFEENFRCTFYNTGRDGNYVLYNYAIFKAITRRYNPKMIIFDIRPEDLGSNAFEYDRLSLLYPYYMTHPEITEIVDTKSPFEKMKRISAIFPYNSLIFQIAMGNLEFNKKRMPDINGYIPFYEIMKNEKIDTSKSSIYTIDENKILALKDIIITCQQKNIKLIFVNSPTWGIIQDDYCEVRLLELCSEYGIPFFDMSNHPIFISSPGYFADKNHLNDEGAKVFSKILSDKLRLIQ
jgi:hypothetical protein